MHRITLLNLLAALFSVHALPAQPPLSMEQAIQQGITNNYQLKRAETELDIARNNNDWSVAGRYPTIDLSATSANSYSNINNPANVLVRSNQFSTDLTPAATLNWVLYDGSRVRLTKRQLEQLEQLSGGNVQLAIEGTVEEVMLAYYNALAQKKGLEVLEEVLELSRDRTEFEELKKEFGQASTFDILQTRDAYLSDSTQYLVQLTNYDNALRNLNLAMGIDDLDQRYTLTDTLVFDPKVYALEELQARMLTNNVSLQNLQLNRELARTNTELERSTRLPTLSLGTGVSYNIGIADGTQTFDFGMGETSRPIPTVGAKALNGFLDLNLSYRLTDFGARKRRIEAVRLQELQTQYDYQDQQRILRTQLANTLATYENRRRVVEVTNAALENARLNLEIATKRFRGNLINSFDFRVVQNSFLTASEAQLTAVFNLKITETELMRLTGELAKLGN
jgi:outer membrane protein TolC